MSSLSRRALDAVRLGLGACLVACAGTRGAPAPAPPSAELSAPNAPVAQDSAADAGASDAADAVVNSALEVVARLRELPPKDKVSGQIISRGEMLERVKREIQSDVPKDVMEASSELLFALGTVDEKFDYEASVLALMQSQLLGFYDPKQKTMFIGGDLGASMEDATLYHELVHALQDQHYDLGKLLKFAPDRSDALSALHALAEGDATSAMMDAVFAPKGLKAIDLPESVLNLPAALGQAFTNVEGVPPILTRSLIAPYFDGLTFTHYLRRRGGWAEVDRAWQNLPASTEQVLHPEKFVSRELPEDVAIPEAGPPFPGDVWYHDVLGEQSLRLVFEEWMPARAAGAQAADWAGDRVAVFRAGERRAVAWRIRFDTGPAAERALSAFAQGVLLGERTSGSPKPDTVTSDSAVLAVRPGQLCRERHTRGPFAVARRGREVVVTAGPYLRGPTGVRTDGDCVSALRWAQKLLSAKP